MASGPYLRARFLYGSKVGHILIYRCIWSSFERIDFYIWKFTLFFGTVRIYSNNNVKSKVEKADKVKELTQIEQVKSIDEHRAGVGAGRADKSSQ